MKIILGVGGGIAAYKSAELARALAQNGHAVQVVMTAAAQEFVRPLTFAALTGRKVITDMFPAGGAEGALSSAVEHIGVALEHEALVVAPATADLMAKFAHGIANDFLTTLYLAFTGPVVIAPAMNTNMWRHPATQENLLTLRRRGHHIVDPEDGYLACGMTGPGRLAASGRIAEAVEAALARRADLAGETVLITAGPTREPLDPVRFISNRSSGKMGYALAEAARARGAAVILVSGPVSLPPPAGVDLVRVETARQMRDAVMANLERAGIVIKAAAVADYAPVSPAGEKIKKAAGPPAFQLAPTPDILAELGRNKGSRLLVGFAAETGNLEREAHRKLEAKNCDMVVANLVGREGTGFDADENEVVLALRSGETVPLARAAKRQIADRIFDEILKLRLWTPNRSAGT
ncbi:MAG: bifunctional phosphopantothenoylcysteine decarboxylase/phosphopantothenate--cysteine ligase CoaBC [Bryobacteraceae bacterium]